MSLGTSLHAGLAAPPQGTLLPQIHSLPYFSNLAGDVLALYRGIALTCSVFPSLGTCLPSYRWKCSFCRQQPKKPLYLGNIKPAYGWPRLLTKCGVQGDHPPAGGWGRAPKPYAAAFFVSVASVQRTQETRLFPKPGFFQRSDPAYGWPAGNYPSFLL